MYPYYPYPWISYPYPWIRYPYPWISYPYPYPSPNPYKPVPVVLGYGYRRIRVWMTITLSTGYPCRTLRQATESGSQRRRGDVWRRGIRRPRGGTARRRGRRHRRRGAHGVVHLGALLPDISRDFLAHDLTWPCIRRQFPSFVPINNSLVRHDDHSP